MTSPARLLGPPLLDTARGAPCLVLGRCAACGRAHFPAADSCPWCGGEGCARDRGGSCARLWLWTTVAARPPGYRGPIPYGLGVVELEDVPLRVVTRIAAPPDGPLHEGQRMRLVVENLPLDDGAETVCTWAYTPVIER